MKRLVSITVGVILLLTLCVTVGADSQIGSNNIEYGVISGDLTVEDAELFYNTGTIKAAGGYHTNSILCLFGHSIAYGAISETTHNYYTNAPHCRQHISNIEYCTRSSCSYCVVTSDFYMSAGCH